MTLQAFFFGLAKGIVMLRADNDYLPDFRLLFESSPHPYLVVRPDAAFTIAAVNDRYLAATGTERDVILGRALFEVFPDNPDDHSGSGVADLRTSLQRVIANGMADVMGVQKYDIPHADGARPGFETRYWSPVNAPVFDQAGRLVFIIHHVEDVTDFIVSREKASHEHSTRLRKVEARAERMEAEVMRRATEVKNANRQLKAAVEQLEKREAELARLNVRLRELDQAKTEFFANVSHEFRTPLTLLLGPIEDALAQNMSMPSPVLESRRLLEIAHRNALRLLKLVNTLLDFSRIEAGKVRPQQRAVDLAEFTAGIASNFRSLCELAGLELAVECPSLPDPIMIDTDMWEKIVLNLLSNAFKFTFHGRITVHLEQRGGEVELRISDTGTGIPQEELDHLFERFHRVAEARGRSNEGSGIGLALVRDLAQLLGGDITVESREGAGSSFIVRVPLVAAQEPAIVAPADAGSVGSDFLANTFVLEARQWLPEVRGDGTVEPVAPASVTGRVVVADDNADMRHYIQGLLQQAGFAALACSDTAAALACCRADPPDLLLSDIMMPGMDGFALLRDIRADARLASMPVILLSARAGEEARVKGLSSGADDYLVKPFPAKELIARVEGVIRLAAIRRQAEAAMRSLAQEIGDLYDHAPCGYHSLDASGKVVRMNRTELDWLGFDAADVVGTTHFADLLSPGTRARFEEDFRRLPQDGRFQDREYELVRRDGSTLPVLASANVVRDADDRFLFCRVVVLDHRERRRDEEHLRQAATVFANTNEAIVVAAPDRRIVAVNQAFSRITGFEPEEVLGQTPYLLRSGRHDDVFYRNMMSLLDSSGQWEGEIWNRRKTGELYPAWENISVVRDEQGRITHYVAIFSDISAIKDAEEKIVHLAHHDALTGLPNRLRFTANLDNAMAQARRHGRKVGLLLLDLDRFKLVNDTLGHAAGDKLLCVVADRIQQSLRDEDTVARLGGDEFAVIISELSHPDDAVPLANKIIRAIAEPFSLLNKDLATSASIGISLYPDDAQNAEDLVRSADAAMYRAKARGRNTYHFYSTEMQAEAAFHLALETDIRKALAGHQFELYYQPQIALRTGDIVGVEALLRWQHPDRGLIPPNEFIHIAEDSGLIEPLGAWILETAIAQAADWAAQGLGPLRMAVNVSGRQLLYDHFLATLGDTLARHPPLTGGVTLELEITESVLLSYERCEEAFRRMKEHGLSIAIDDFGTGYSSLSRLKHLDVDTLKVDRAFIRNLPSAPDDQAITAAIIAMAHSLGLNVIAEGVESDGQMEFLRAHQCDEVQGFAISEAVSGPAMTETLRARGRPQGHPDVAFSNASMLQ